MCEHVMVPVDGSGCSTAAAEETTVVADGCDARLSLLHVLNLDDARSDSARDRLAEPAFVGSSWAASRSDSSASPQSPSSRRESGTSHPERPIDTVRSCSLSTGPRRGEQRRSADSTSRGVRRQGSRTLCRRQTTTLGSTGTGTRASHRASANAGREREGRGRGPGGRTRHQRDHGRRRGAPAVENLDVRRRARDRSDSDGDPRSDR